MSMYGYVPEELAWAIEQERREEARRTRPHTERWRAHPEPLRALLARLLVRLGVCLDPTAGERALRAANNGC